MHHCHDIGNGTDVSDVGSIPADSDSIPDVDTPSNPGAGSAHSTHSVGCHVLHSDSPRLHYPKRSLSLWQRNIVNPSMTHACLV